MASNIRVVLEVDNKKYIADVKRAEDATTKFAQNTAKSLGTIDPRITALGQKFSNLAAGIVALGLGAAVTNAIRFADSLQDISNATGIAVENVMAFSNAVALNGGSAEGAQKAILKLSNSIDAAASSSSEARDAFYSIGVNLRDLERLSEKDILEKTIQGLAKITDASKRSATAQQLLGKEARAIDFKNLGNDYAKAAGDLLKYRDSVRAASDLQDKLDRAFQKLQLAILKTIQPLAEFINKLDEQQIQDIVDAIVNLGKGFAILAAAAPTLRAIGSIVGGLALSFGLAAAGMGTLRTAFTGGLAAVSSLGTTLKVTAKVLALYSAPAWLASLTNGTGLFKAMGTTVEMLGKRLGFAAAAGQGLSYALGAGAAGLVKLIPIIGQLAAGLFIVDGALKLITGRDISGWFDNFAGKLEDFVRSKAPALASALDKLGEKLGMAPPPSEQRAAAEANAQELKRIQNRADSLKAERDAREANLAKQRELGLKIKEFQLTQNETVDGLENANRTVLQRIAHETKLIGLSQQQKEILDAQEDALQRQRPVIQGIQQEMERIQLDIDAGRNVEENRMKLDILAKTIRRVWAETDSAYSILETYISAQQRAASVERMRIQGMVQMNELENLRAQLIGYSLTEYEKFNQALRAGELRDKTVDEVAQLADQALARDALTQKLTAENIVRETSSKLLDLETSILGRQFSELEKLEQLKNSNPEAFARKTQAEVTALRQQAAAIDETIAQYNALAFARDLQRQGEDFTAGIRDQLRLDSVAGESARRRIQIEIDGRNQLETKLREIRDRYGDEIKLSEELRGKRRQELDEATNAINNLTALKRKSVEEDQALRDSFVFGWDTAYSKYAESAKNAAEQATTYFNTFTRGFEDAIVRFVQTGKLSFKDLANSIIAEFVRIQARQLALSLFGGAGGGGGLFGNLFKGVGSIFGFANGGNPAMGKPILVGERGPELMIPRNASTIVPNEMLGGGSVTNVTYQIQAVDASSFRALVARDPEFLFAVTEQGRRQLPNRGRR